MRGARAPPAQHVHVHVLLTRPRLRAGRLTWRNRTAEFLAIENMILDDIRRIGFGHRPHLLNFARCYTRDGSGDLVGMTALPTLLRSTQFLRVCTDAVAPVDERGEPAR